VALLAALRDIEGEQRAAHGAPLILGARDGVSGGRVHCALWDMDGVLVEVAGSYRQAIIDTAAAFGVKGEWDFGACPAHHNPPPLSPTPGGGGAVTHGDIDAVKAAGNANNDWVVTHRLIAAARGASTGAESAAGVGVGGSAAAPVPTLAEVTARFERLYQGDGTAAAPGLKATEKALVSVDTLLAVKARCRGGMAVVTGRPRKDAEEAIVRYGWGGVFDAVVTMEDAAAKPDPAPVLLACARLAEKAGADGAAAEAFSPGHAVMLGDTVDDIAAAARAGATGVGVFPPDKAPGAGGGDERSAALRDKLVGAGAQRVLLPGCTELLALLPPVEDAASLRAANARRVAEFATAVTGSGPAGGHGVHHGSAATATAAASAGAAGSAHHIATAGAGVGAGGGTGASRGHPTPDSLPRTVGTGVGRVGACERRTKETDIRAWINLDGAGEAAVATGCVRPSAARSHRRALPPPRVPHRRACHARTFAAHPRPPPPPSPLPSFLTNMCARARAGWVSWTTCSLPSPSTAALTWCWAAAATCGSTTTTRPRTARWRWVRRSTRRWAAGRTFGGGGPPCVPWTRRCPAW
jgi:HAD superfamily hydrolase (TIGR01548 family)